MLPVQFELSPKDLRTRYRNLQSAVHPDNYVGGTAQERRLAVQISAHFHRSKRTCSYCTGFGIINRTNVIAGRV